jgi:hypothetical protein
MAATTTTITTPTPASTSSTTTTTIPATTASVTTLVIPRLTPDQREPRAGAADQPAEFTDFEIPKYVPQNTRRWQANQYGCHSDGRCLDDYDTWCDDSDMVELENASGGEVCYETYEWLVDDLAEEFEDE